MTPPLSEQQLAEYRAIAERATNRPFLLSDCEGVLKVWAESALKRVTRDAEGTITGWSEPGSYTAADLVAEVDLDMGTWDPGQDVDDDQRRQDVGDMVEARPAVATLLAEVDRLNACATGAWRRIDDTLNYLASRDTTDWPAEALGLGLDILAYLDTAPHPSEDVPARPALPWSAFLTDVEVGCLVEELASVFLDYWRGERKADAATLAEVERLLVKHRDGSQAAEAAGKDTDGGTQPPAGESTHADVTLPDLGQEGSCTGIALNGVHTQVFNCRQVAQAHEMHLWRTGLEWFTCRGEAR